ncbi:MAG TPA: hypothetical protein DEG17_03125, partial [Cyanobacteria bacterium UBA11149]|nr:hypothetical protein [Cyanobacteria bacterium UBA11149]
LRLIAGMIDAKSVGEIIDYLCQQKGKKNNFINLFLAAKCLDEVKNRQIIAKTDNQLFELLKSLIKYDLNYYYRLHDIPEETQRVRDIRTQAVAAIATTW